MSWGERLKRERRSEARPLRFIKDRCSRYALKRKNRGGNGGGQLLNESIKKGIDGASHEVQRSSDKRLVSRGYGEGSWRGEKREGGGAV